MSAADGSGGVADRLYALPPAGFVGARDEAVQVAKAAGDRAGAVAIGKLRRPTVAAWLVNLLALRRPERLDEWFDLGSAMRTAQQELRGPALRDLAAQRRGLVAALVAEAVDLAVAAGAPRPGLPVVEVETTLTAALADEDLAHLVRAGRLLKSGQYDGFGEAWRPDLHMIEGGATDAPAMTRASSTPPAPATKRASRTPPAPATARAPAAGKRPATPPAMRSMRSVPEAGTAEPPEATAEHPRLVDATAEVAAAEAGYAAAVTAVDDRSREVGEIEERLARLRKDRQAAHSALLAANAASDAADARLQQAQRRLAAAQRAAKRHP